MQLKVSKNQAREIELRWRWEMSFHVASNENDEHVTRWWNRDENVHYRENEWDVFFLESVSSRLSTDSAGIRSWKDSNGFFLSLLAKLSSDVVQPEKWREEMRKFFSCSPPNSFSSVDSHSQTSGNLMNLKQSEKIGDDESYIKRKEMMEKKFQ